MNAESSQEITGLDEDQAPYWTAKKFARLTGTPLRTVQEQVQQGLLPRFDPRPKSERDRRFPVYINMVKVREMAANGSTYCESD